MADEISEKDLADLKIEENDEESTNYKAPAKKTINELNDLDAEDESLRKYKEVRFHQGSVDRNLSVPNQNRTTVLLTV